MAFEDNLDVQMAIKARNESMAAFAQATGDLEKLGLAADTAMQRVGRNENQGLLKSFSVFRSKLLLASFGIGLVAGGIAKLGASVRGAAFSYSDLIEAQNKVNEVFGLQQGRILGEWADDAAIRLGQTRVEALATVGALGNLFTEMEVSIPAATEMSVTMTNLASDLASFHNIQPAEAIEKLTAGLVGEVRPLRELGVALNETVVKHRALANGAEVVGGKIAEVDKVIARYQLILESTGNAQGDYQRTADELANAQRSLGAVSAEAGRAFGEVVEPMVKDATIALRDFIDENGEDAMRELGEAVVQVADDLGKMLGALNALVSTTWDIVVRLIPGGDPGIWEALGYSAEAFGDMLRSPITAVERGGGAIDRILSSIEPSEAEMIRAYLDAPSDFHGANLIRVQALIRKNLSEMGRLDPAFERQLWDATLAEAEGQYTSPENRGFRNPEFGDPLFQQLAEGNRGLSESLKAAREYAESLEELGIPQKEINRLTLDFYSELKDLSPELKIAVENNEGLRAAMGLTNDELRSTEEEAKATAEELTELQKALISISETLTNRVVEEFFRAEAEMEGSGEAAVAAMRQANDDMMREFTLLATRLGALGIEIPQQYFDAYLRAEEEAIANHERAMEEQQRLAEQTQDQLVKDIDRLAEALTQGLLRERQKIHEETLRLLEAEAEAEREAAQARYDSRIAVLEAELHLLQQIADVDRRRHLERDLALAYTAEDQVAARQALEAFDRQQRSEELRQQMDELQEVFNEELDVIDERYQAEVDRANQAYDEMIDAYRTSVEVRQLIEQDHQAEMLRIIQSYYPEWYTAGFSLGQQLGAGLHAGAPTDFIGHVTGAVSGGSGSAATSSNINQLEEWMVSQALAGTSLPSSTLSAISSAVQSQTGVYLDFRGANFNGTPEENAQAIRDIFDQWLADNFGSDAVAHGVAVVT